MAVNIKGISSTPVRTRIGGSGFTVFCWDGGDSSTPLTPIAFAKTVNHQSAQPVGPGTVPIHPMDEPYPVELITPMATTMGTVTLELYEVFGENIWSRLSSFQDANGNADNGVVDLANIFFKVQQLATPIRIVKFIRPTSKWGYGASNSIAAGTQATGVYTEEYNNCVVSSVMHGETIEIGSMEVVKQIVINYTYITRNGVNNIVSMTGGNLGFAAAKLDSSSNPAGFSPVP